MIQFDSYTTQHHVVLSDLGTFIIWKNVLISILKIYKSWLDEQKVSHYQQSNIMILGWIRV